MRWHSPLTPFIAAILSGVMLALCFPPFDRAHLLWFWQVPLFAVLWFWEPGPLTSLRWPFRLPRWLWAALAGWVAGAAFFLVSLFWIRHVAWAGMIVLALYLALYPALWAAFAATLGRLHPASITPHEPDPLSPSTRSPKLKALLADARKTDLLAPSLHTLRAATLCAAAWVSTEWLRSVVFTGFGWNGLGVALHDSPHLRQAADFAGVTGLSFLPVFVTAVLVSTVFRFALELGRARLRPHLDFAVAMALLIATFLYGLHALRSHPMDDPVTLSGVLVQGNVSIEQRYGLDPDQPPSEIFDLYKKLTSLYAGQGYDLILWPETSLPSSFYEASTLRYLNAILALGDFQLLTGIEQVRLREDGNLDIFNSMILMQGTADSYQDYQKIHRVPFGEFIPFRHSFPIFTWALGRLIPEDFDAGTNFTLLQLRDPDIAIIPTICFEDTIGRLTRRFLTAPPLGPQVIVNVTNDSWFNQSPANIQHLSNARFRSIELKRPMIRCANTGISCVIDEFGSLQDPESIDPNDKRIFLDRDTGSPFLTGCFPFRLQIDSQPSTTIYARYGDWFSYVLLLLTASTLAFAARRRTTRHPTPSAELFTRP